MDKVICKRCKTLNEKSIVYEDDDNSTYVRAYWDEDGNYHDSRRVRAFRCSKGHKFTRTDKK